MEKDILRTMILFPICAILACASLATLFVTSVLKASPEKRKLYVLPGAVQLFAISIALVRGGIFPGFLPGEIVTIFCYFFSLYITFSAAISLSAPNRKISALWIISAVAFWILAILGI